MDTAQKSLKRALGQMLLGNQVQQAIYVATKLGIPDLLKDGPRQSHELARATGTHAGALYRLLRALASFGLFSEKEEGLFELTPMAALLQADRPDTLRPYALWSGDVSYQAFGGLEHSVRTGTPAFEQIFGTDFYTYLARHPETGALFDELMARHSAPVARQVAAYDFAGANTVVDVGGGHGKLLAAVLCAHSTMRGVLIDQPHVIQGANGFLEAAGMADRCTTVCGDILEAVPHGGDVYLLKSVIHGMDDDTAARLLGNCRRVMNEDARVLLIEFVMPSGNDPFPGKLMDLLMLVGGYGRERTEEEFRTLLAAAKLRLTNITPTKTAYSVIEGKAA